MFDYLIWTDQILFNLWCLCMHKAHLPFHCEICGLFLFLFGLIGVDILTKCGGASSFLERMSSGKTRKALYFVPVALMWISWED